MTDLTANFSQLYKPVPEKFGISDSDFIWPQYDGRSILNIPVAVSDALGAPIALQPSLADDLTAGFGNDVQRVILVLVDALGWNLLQRWLKAGDAELIAALAEQGALNPITSISPSTTTAALTSYWTASPPASHGVAGYELWLKEFGLVANMISQNPFNYYGGQHNLENIGFDPETFVPAGTMGDHYAANGIQSVSFQHSHITGSGLSRTFMAGTEQKPFHSTADQWYSLRNYVEGNLDEKHFIWTYYPMVDTLSHMHGPDDPRVLADFQNFCFTLEQQFLNKLTLKERAGTLLLISADHGQIHTPQKPKFEISSRTDFMDMLHMAPTGENRMTYLHVKPGRKAAVNDYIAETWPGDFYVFESKELVEAGLFGPGPVYPPLFDRIGDLTVLPRGNAYFWWSARKDPLHGRHGGLHQDEMVVPLLSVRLDG